MDPEEDSLESKVNKPFPPLNKPLLMAGVIVTGIYALGALVLHNYFPEQKDLIEYVDGLVLCGAGVTVGFGLAIGLMKLYLKND